MPNSRSRTSPTQRTLKYLREHGFYPAVVEKTVPYSWVKQDLYGCIDIVAVGKGRTLGVQATSGDNFNARIYKALDECPLLEIWILAGNEFWVYGWKKYKRTNRWEVRKKKITLEHIVQRHSGEQKTKG